MADRFITYETAYSAARDRANSSGLDVAIRKTKEYGRLGLNVSYASRNDSDYARAEIVNPDVSQEGR